MTSRTVRAALVVLAALSIFASAAAQEAPAPTMSFAFAWPNARGTVTATRRMTSRGAPTGARGELRYPVRIETNADGVRWTAGQLTLAPARGGTPEESLQAVLVLSDHLPSFGGRARDSFDLVDAAAASVAIDAAAVAALPADARESPQWPMVRTTWAAPALTTLVDAHLRTWVDSLRGRALTVGRDVESAGESVTIAGVSVPQRSRMRLESLVGCQRQGARRCAEVSIRAVYDPAALAQLATRMGISSFAMEGEARLVTEIETLLPHSITTTTARRLQVGTTAMDEVEVREMRFDWNAAPAPPAAR